MRFWNCFFALFLGGIGGGEFTYLDATWVLGIAPTKFWLRPFVGIAALFGAAYFLNKAIDGREEHPNAE